MGRAIVSSHLAVAMLVGVAMSNAAFAQSTVLDGTATRSFHGLTSTGPRRFESNSEAQEAVNKVLSVLPSPHQIEAFVSDDPADVPNAEARIDPTGKRIIGFNRAFMRFLAAQAGNYWSLMGIAAHEIGHHVGNHNFLPTDCQTNNRLELEADFHAGFALGKLSVKLDEATSTMRTSPVVGGCSHPGREQRVLVMGQGWRQATGTVVVAGTPSATAAPTEATRSVTPVAPNVSRAPDLTAKAAATRAVDERKEKTALDSFKIKRNRDVYGFDIAKLPGLSRNTCAESCLKTPKCKGFSFDVWNGWCFLKDDMPASVLDPASVIAVRTDKPFPNLAAGPSEIYRLRRKKFVDRPLSSAPMASYEACYASCNETAACVAFTFGKDSNVCQMFANTDGYFYDEKFDSGFKRQQPPPAAPGPATATVRMVVEKDRIFKGNGYARHEDASQADCQALCLRDSICKAYEHTEKQKVCRLYAKEEQALPASGTDVAFKRTN
jgi:hypothetical protein